MVAVSGNAACEPVAEGRLTVGRCRRRGRPLDTVEQRNVATDLIRTNGVFEPVSDIDLPAEPCTLEIEQELPALLERDHHERLGATGHNGLSLRGKRSGSEVVAFGEHDDVTKFGGNEFAEALTVLVGAPQNGHGCGASLATMSASVGPWRLSEGAVRL